nr:sister chromatid cohesion protein PDS5 [Streptomyces sp. NBC_00830]
MSCSTVFFHQGGWICPAATAALPFVLAVAAIATVQQRLTLLELVERLADTAVTAEPRFVDQNWPDAWAQSRPAMVALLGDVTPAVRRAAVAILAAGLEPVAQTLTLLRERWEQDADQATRLAALVALGQAAVKAAPDELGRVTSLLDSLLSDGRPAVRLAALHALGFVDREAPARHLDLLIDTLAARQAATELPEAWADATLASLTVESYNLVAGKPEIAAAFVTRLVTPTRPVELRCAGLERAGLLLAQWRSPATDLLPVLARSLEAAEPEIRVQAAHLLAALGSLALPYAEQLVAHLADHGSRPSRRVADTVADNALWALSRFEDPRCLPGLVDRLFARRAVFATHGSHYSPRFLYFPTLPGMHEVLMPLGAHADVLLPDLRALLRRVHASDDQEAARACAQVLAAWGPAALPALPELADLLAHPQLRRFAAEALAAIGPGAADALPDLRRAEAGLAAGTSTAASERQLFVWARARLGDDPKPALEFLGAAMEEDRVFHAAIRYLGDLGPQAAAQAGRLHRLLGETHPGSWEQVEAAIALWKVTDAPEPSLQSLERAVLPLAQGRYLPVMRRAVEGLTGIGRLGAETRSALEAALTLDRRLTSSGSWRSFVEDEQIRHAVHQLIAAVG